jgi:hypothetical protein
VIAGARKTGSCSLSPHGRVYGGPKIALVAPLHIHLIQLIVAIIVSHIVVYITTVVYCIIHYMPEAASSPPRYGPPSRGITSRDVEVAADALLRAGERPTIEKIREKIGRGSPNTINPILDVWWKRLASRLDAGPAALHRLPESVAHVAEALWVQALDEGRRRAEQETTRDARTASQTKSDLEVRSHVLTLREGELETRLKDRERQQATLEIQLQELIILLRKEQSTRDAQTRRIASLENELLAKRSASGRAVRAFHAPTKRQRRSPKRAAKLRRSAKSKTRSTTKQKRSSMPMLRR